MKSEELLIGESDAIIRLRKDLPKYAARKDNILIEGEPGSGKCTVARMLHGLSSARGDMLEIGPHGADDATLGAALGKGGGCSTLLIQDVGEYSFLHQSMIASFIRAQASKRGPRVIVTVADAPGELAASNSMLGELATMLGKFIRVAIPPLSKRVNDIPLLAQSFMRNAASVTGHGPKTMENGILDFLRRRTWKGNVQELKSVVEKAVLESEGAALELPAELVDEAAQLRGILSSIGEKKRFSFDKALSNLERTLIERTLAGVSGNQSHAAEILNLSEANLRYRMKKFKIR